MVLTLFTFTGLRPVCGCSRCSALPLRSRFTRCGYVVTHAFYPLRRLHTFAFTVAVTFTARCYLRLLHGYVVTVCLVALHTAVVVRLFTLRCRLLPVYRYVVVGCCCSFTLCPLRSDYVTVTTLRWLPYYVPVTLLLLLRLLPLRLRTDYVYCTHVGFTVCYVTGYTFARCRCSYVGSAFTLYGWFHTRLPVGYRWVDLRCPYVVAFTLLRTFDFLTLRCYCGYHGRLRLHYVVTGSRLPRYRTFGLFTVTFCTLAIRFPTVTRTFADYVHIRLVITCGLLHRFTHRTTHTTRALRTHAFTRDAFCTVVRLGWLYCYVTHTHVVWYTVAVGYVPLDYVAGYHGCTRYRLVTLVYGLVTLRLVTLRSLRGCCLLLRLRLTLPVMTPRVRTVTRFTFGLLRFIRLVPNGYHVGCIYVYVLRLVVVFTTLRSRLLPVTLQLVVALRVGGYADHV